MVENADNTDEQVTGNDVYHISELTFDALACYTCEHEDSGALHVQAMTRPQAVKEKQRQLDIDQDNLMLARQLPFFDSQVQSQDESKYHEN